MKLMIVGKGRHGKDYCAEFMRERIGLRFESSSLFFIDLFGFAKLKDKYNYKTVQECYEDRSNHRAELFDLICEYNKEDLTALASKIFEKNDCYVGIRSYEELEAAKKRWPEMTVVWIDASERVSYSEDQDSCTVTKEQAHYTLDNNKDLEHINNQLITLCRILEIKSSNKAIKCDSQ